MQRKSVYTDDMILGVIGLIISVGIPVFFLIQFIPIYILLLANEYSAMRLHIWHHCMWALKKQRFLV